MHARRLVAVVLPLAALLGCSQNPAPAPAAASSTAAPAPPPPGPSGSGEAKRGPRERGRRGGGMMMSPAMRYLHEAEDLEGLTDAQKATLEKLKKDLRPEGAGWGDMKELHTDLVAGVRAGKIDTTKIDARTAEAEKAMTARRDKELEALSALHAALKPEQRKALVAELKEHGPKAHEGGDKPKPDAAAFTKHRVEHLTKLLDLDAAQQKKVEAIVGKDVPDPAAMEAAREAWKKSSDALAAAFEGDAFDPKKIDLMPAVAKDKKGKGPLAREAAFLAELLPILKPEQREKLAASMEKPRGRHPGGGFGFFEDHPGGRHEGGGKHDDH